MLTLHRLALELLEYKVKDLRLKRKPSGEGSTPWELYDHLLEEMPSLTPDERRRFEALGNDLKRYGEVNVRKTRSVASFDQLTLDGVTAVMPRAFPAEATDLPGRSFQAPQTPAEVEEQKTLQRLARKVWWSDIERVAQRLAASSRAERDRATARMVYALLRNLSHHARSSSFADDLDLRQFAVKEPVSDLADPLASFNDIENIKELYLNLVETILTLSQPESPHRVNLPSERSFGYLRKMALLVARNPYAGQLSSFKAKSANSKQLRLAMEEMSKEPMREEHRRAQRKQLEARLSEALAHEKTQRQHFERDVLRFQEAVEGLFEKLRPYLSKRVGGEAAEPQLPGGVLFAENPALKLDEIPQGSRAVTLQFKGPLRFSLSDVPLALVGSAEAPVLYVKDHEVPVQGTMDLEVGQQRLKVFCEGNYLHLRLGDEARSLAALTAEALVVGYVLRSPHQEALLGALKAAAGVVANDAKEVVRLALERFARLTAKAPDARSALQGLLSGATRAARVSLPAEAVDGLADSLLRSQNVSGSDLDDLLEELEPAKVTMFQLGDDPVNVTLAGLPLTIRQYRGRNRGQPDNVVVMMPGRPLGSFIDYMLEPFGGGLLMCVRSDEDLLVVFFASETDAAPGPE